MQAAKVAAGANSLESFAQVFYHFTKYLFLVWSIWRSSSGTFDNLKFLNGFNLNDRFDIWLREMKKGFKMKTCKLKLYYIILLSYQKRFNNLPQYFCIAHFFCWKYNNTFYRCNVLKICRIIKTTFNKNKCNCRDVRPCEFYVTRCGTFKNKFNLAISSGISISLSSSTDIKKFTSKKYSNITVNILLSQNTKRHFQFENLCRIFKNLKAHFYLHKSNIKCIQ